jgi:hypothetical protein
VRTVSSNKCWSSMSFQNLVRLSQIKKIPCLSKKVEKIAITVVQLDEILLYLRPFYNGAFSIASKNDIDDQNLLLATVHICYR